LPASTVLQGMQLHWSGRDAEYVDDRGRVCAFDPTVRTAGPSACLIREAELVAYLKREELSLCWVVLGEKRCIGPGMMPDRVHSLQMTGAFSLSNGNLVGEVRVATDRK